MSEREYIATAVAALNAPAPRDTYRPDRHEQMAAIEILLASSISADLRSLLREREQALALRKEAA